MRTAEEIQAQLEAKEQELKGRRPRHEGRVRAYRRVGEFVDQELTDAENDLGKVESKLARAGKYLGGKIPTTMVEVVDEDTPRVRNIDRLLGA